MIFLKAKRAISACLALVFILITPPAVRAEVVDRVVAIINDSIITLSELNAATALEKTEAGKDAEKQGQDIHKLKARMLESLIEQRLVKQASDKAGIDVSEREIDNAIEDIKKQNNLSQDSLLVVLAQSGLTYRQYRDQIKEQIREVKFINREFRSKISVTEDDVKEYYSQNIKGFYGPASYWISLIFVPAGPDAKATLRAALEGLKNKEDFKELAKKYSVAASAEAGGDMGYVKSGEMDKALEDAAKGLSAGEVSKPITAPDGTYIIKLIDKKDAAPVPVEEVRAKIQDRLFKKTMDERFSYWLSEVKKAAHIEIRL